ncbi:MAG: ABC transporter permease [Deltaproteobacteria bacterium]
MLNLLKCEFKKFQKTYINSLSFLGMLFPVILITLMFIVKKADFIEHKTYNWEYFNSQLTIMLVFLIGPIITSFIAVFSVFYEYQEKTLKNILSSPNSRTLLILTKIVYVSLYVLLQYAAVAVINVLCALLLGFDFSIASALEKCIHLVVAGFTTIILVPFMMFLTLLAKNFIPPLVITVAGTISNAILMNWEKSYLSPWANPANFIFIMKKSLKMDIMLPITCTCVYFILFMIITIVYFNRVDQC